MGAILKTSPNFSIEYFCDKNALKKPSKMSANMEEWKKKEHEVAGDYSETLNELKNNSNLYKNLLSKDRLISHMFVHLFQREKEKGREKLYKLRLTWTPWLASDLLLELDHAVKRIDKAWPIAKQSTGNTVFVNPNFIPKDKKADKKKESSKVESD